MKPGSVAPGISPPRVRQRPAVPVPGPGAESARVWKRARQDRFGPAARPPGVPGEAYRRATADAMLEDRGRGSLDAYVRALIKDLHLRGYHTYHSERSEEGFPDWVITGTRTIYRELKRQANNPTRPQEAWLDALLAACDDADVWRPYDLLTGRIQSELIAISPLSRAEITQLHLTTFTTPAGAT